MKRHAEAEPMKLRALALDEAGLGKDHPNVANNLFSIAQLLQDTERAAEAEPLLRRALAIDEAAFVKVHQNIARDLNGLVGALRATKRTSEAEPLSKRSLEIFAALSKASGKPSPGLPLATETYRSILMELGDTKEQADENIGGLVGPASK